MDIYAASTTGHNNQPTKKHRFKISTANLSDATNETRPSTHAHRPNQKINITHRAQELGLAMRRA